MKAPALQSSLYVLVIVWIISNAVCLIAASWSFNTDDAYITLRYAKHLAQGSGIVWNIGEDPPKGADFIS